MTTWLPLTVREDPYSVGGIVVDGEGAPLVRQALADLAGRVIDLEKTDPATRIVEITDDLGPDLEAFNAADPHCERCAGLGRISVGIVDSVVGGDEVRLELVPCSCVEEHR